MNKLIILLMGLALGAWLGSIFWTDQASSEKTTDSNQETPLYWVAPMDANYRRDEPGLSPMGMELVPVYASDAAGPDAGPGTIHISPQVENQMAVKTSEVAYGLLNTPQESQGTVTFSEDKTHHIHATSNGWIRDLRIHSVGEHVEKGQLLYRLYSTEWVQAQKEFLLALKNGDSSMIKAAKSRLKAKLFPNRAIDMLMAKNEVIESVPFFAHQSGTITAINVQNGHQVKSSEPLMVIVDSQKVWLDIEWLSPQTPLIQLGTQVEAQSHLYPNRTWKGQIDHIYPQANSQNRSLLTRVTLDNSDGLLKANMNMTAYVVSPNSETALLIPNSALIQVAKQTRVVLSLGQGSYKSVAVQLGLKGETHSQVLSGLKAGDAVVTSAHFLLDSESSKTSDFIRMGEETWPSAQVKGVVINNDPNHRTLTIQREAITQWQRGPATVEFWVENAIDIKDIKKNTEVDFHFEIRNGAFIITAIKEMNHD